MKKALIFILLILPPLAFAQQDTAAAQAAAKNQYFAGEREAALEAYKDISKKTNGKEAFLNAAFISMELGRPRDCTDIVNAALKVYPKDTELLEYLGEAYLSDGQFLASEKIFSALIEQNKKDLYYIDLARSRLGLGETDAAAASLETAAKGETLVSYSNYMLGALYEQKQDYSAAEKYYQKAINYDSQFLEARLRYAGVLEKLQNINEAWKQYRTVYTADRNIEAAKKAMDAMEPKLTKTKQELLQPKEITEHTAIKEIAADAESSAIIKVGIGAKADGSPSTRDALVFNVNGNFQIADSKTGALVAAGSKDENWEIKIIKGKTYIIPPKKPQILFTSSITIKPVPSDAQTPTIVLRKIITGASMTWASEDDKEYRGDIEVNYNRALKTLVVINHVNIEDYLAGVLASEMPPRFPQEALRAQAVLARTYALRHLSRHKKYGYDLCDTQNCQVYGGVQAESEPTTNAVKATEGVMLDYNGKPADTVFSSNCGGFTQSSKDAGWSQSPYLVPTSDYKNFDFANLQPYQFKELLQYPQDAYSKFTRFLSPASYRWARVVQESDLRDVIKKNKKDIGRILSIVPTERSISGYASKVLVTGEKGSVTLEKENSIRRNLALGMLRSAYFIVQPVYVNKELKEFVFFGGGWGHGVGFCQTGAAGRADEGQKYEDIILHYYPGTELKDIRKN
ncbi:MAG: SpoIID/LytB domain-containing protein [Elusimicrobium sp.]|jgi:SpoIID/LytB domain protein|nr:SpoIID/LytB domain-containing protein [Elusimicrobium sp.]